MADIEPGAAVFVPVTDQNRALAFYAETLGFERRTDFRYAGGERWVEVLAPGNSVAIALLAQPDGEPVGIEMRVAIGSDDIDADHARYREVGVEVGAILREEDPVERNAERTRERMRCTPRTAAQPRAAARGRDGRTRAGSRRGRGRFASGSRTGGGRARRRPRSCPAPRPP